MGDHVGILGVVLLLLKDRKRFRAELYVTILYCFFINAYLQSFRLNTIPTVLMSIALLLFVHWQDREQRGGGVEE